jgi:hypothetical protein
MVQPRDLVVSENLSFTISRASKFVFERFVDKILDLFQYAHWLICKIRIFFNAEQSATEDLLNMYGRRFPAKIAKQNIFKTTC